MTEKRTLRDQQSDNNRFERNFGASWEHATCTYCWELKRRQKDKASSSRSIGILIFKISLKQSNRFAFLLRNFFSISSNLQISSGFCYYLSNQLNKKYWHWFVKFLCFFSQSLLFTDITDVLLNYYTYLQDMFCQHKLFSTKLSSIQLEILT